MIFGFSSPILSIFGQQPFGPDPGASSGTQADQNMEDLYTIRVGIDSGDSQAQMQAFAGDFKNLGADVSQTSAAIHAGFRRINRYLGLLGVNISGMGMARQFIAMDQAVRNFQRGMFDASREASRGGGALLQWTEMNRSTLQQYMNIVARARSNWRRSEQEIVGMFRNVGRSGIAAAANIQISTDDIEAYLTSLGRESTQASRVWAESQLRMQRSVEELGAAVMLGFKLEFLGLSAQQVQSLYHSMSVNLRMDMASIEEALYKVFVTSGETSFAWQEHIRYIDQALARYSKLGVSIEDVSAYLLTMVERVRSAEGAFDRVGVVYEMVMDRMGIRQQLGPEQQMRLFQMISPEQIGSIIGAPGTQARESFEQNLAAGVNQLDPSRQFTTQDVLSRRLDPTQYLVVWQSMNEGMMNLVRLQAMRNIMSQQGAMGTELMPIWAAQMPEFATFWRSYQAGLLLDPGGLEKEFQAWRDSATTMEGRVQAAEERLPPEMRGADKFWGRVETQMTQLYGMLEGWKQAAGRRWDQFFMFLRSGEFREALIEARDVQRIQTRSIQENAAIQYMLGELPIGWDPEQVLSGLEPLSLRRFIDKRFGKVRTPLERTAALGEMTQDFVSVMSRFVDTTPEGQRAFRPLGFAEAGAEKKFLGLDLQDFMTFYKVLLRTRAPGSEQLPVLSDELLSILEEAGKHVRQQEVDRLRLEAIMAPGGGGFDFTSPARRGAMYREMLKSFGIPVQVPLVPRTTPEVEEPTSYIVPGVTFPGKGRRLTIEAMKEESLALGGGTRPGELPAIHVTAYLNMGPGQSIMFNDVLTRVEMDNQRTRNIAGEPPQVG